MKNSGKQSTTKYRRVAILGSEGQLGHELALLFADEAEVLGLAHRDCDIADEVSLRAALEAFRPDLIINAAAYNSVEQAAINADTAYRVNAIGPYVAACLANTLGIPFVHFSTDYVFDGNTKDGFVETDTPHPLNVYGASKRAGEELVAIATTNHWVVRTSALYGAHRGGGKGYNFVTMMLDKARRGESIQVVADQWTVPTYTLDLARGIKALLAQDVPFGIYHLVSEGSATWFDFAQEIFRVVQLSPDIKPIATALSGTNIDRPKRSILKNEQLKKSGIVLPPWKDGLRRYMSELH